MPPDRGRASRACASCRKQKTRCYESGGFGSPCFRCERLHQKCSFVQSPIPEESPASGPELSTAARLERLENVVSSLLERLGEDPGQVKNVIQSGQPAKPIIREAPPATLDNATEGTTSAAPVIMIRDLAADTGVQSPSLAPQGAGLEGLIPPELALTLVTIFLEHYGRWVLFDPESDPKALLDKVRKSTLLFAACCLIAVRHTSEELAASLAPKLYESARSLVQSALLMSPQPIEFFQAALVLCMWSTTVGQVPLSIDSWLLSGFALQHCQSSSLFNAVTSFTSSVSNANRETLDRWFLWNHLCLVHLHYCIGTSRRPMLQSWHIERCRAVIDSDRATNYELRMVAEIHLYWAVYELSAGDSANVARSLAGLQCWKQDWQFVLDQPRAQFLLMGFDFCHLILYDRCLKSKSARAQESVVSEMISHSTAIIRLAMETMDERTRHLSDHIYHVITFAAIVVCRLLGSYEQQLARANNVEQLHSLIRSLVQWLHSIGLPSHAAHTLGNIIDRLYQKLQLPPQPVQDQSTESSDLLSEDFTRYYFPEFLGVGTTPNGSWDLAPNFSFFPQDSEIPDATD